MTFNTVSGGLLQTNMASANQTIKDADKAYKKSSASGLGKVWHHVKNESLGRGYRLSLVAGSVLTGINDIALAVVTMVPTVLTWGQNKGFRDQSFTYLTDGCNALVGMTYVNLLKTVNLRAEVDGDLKPEASLLFRKVVNMDRPEWTKGDGFFKAQILSRCILAIKAVATLVCSVMESVVGLMAIWLPFITVGKVESLNDFGLNAGSFIQHIPDYYSIALRIFAGQTPELAN